MAWKMNGKEHGMAEKIYVAYSLRDEKAAAAFARKLEKNGFPCFRGSSDVLPSQDWAETVAEMIANAPAGVVIVSDNTFDSRQIIREIALACQHEKPIICAMLSEYVSFSGPEARYLMGSRSFQINEPDDEKKLLAYLREVCGSAETKKEPEYAGKPEKPYDGSEPYIFISYAHKDKNKVFRTISRLQQEGYRVWYDEGIDPGTEWDENIAQHIMNCGYLIAFISGNYIGSDNCKDEINLARDLNKDRLLVYLEPTTLPLGMSMRLHRLQAIHEYTYEDRMDFNKKLLSAAGLEKCK